MLPLHQQPTNLEVFYENYFDNFVVVKTAMQESNSLHIIIFYNDCSTNELITVLSVLANVHYCLKI